MTASRYRLTAPARRDLGMIRRWLRSEAGEARAGAMLMRLANSLELIGNQPRIGRLRPEIGEDIRSFAVTPYVVFYQVKDDLAFIARIIHGERDLETAFDENNPTK